MVQLTIVPGDSEVLVKAKARALGVPPQLREVPGGLFPLMSAAFEVDEYRILSGWPVPVPEADIRIECLVTAEGDILGNREEPAALTTNADFRWVADSNYYDQTSLLWAPIQGSCSPWTTSVEAAPILVSDYEYRNGNERFVEMTALNFDSDTADYMWNDMTLAMGGASGYTLIMVACPNSIYGNNPGVSENALWGPSDLSGSWVSFTVKNEAVYMSTEATGSQKGVSIANALSSSAPWYLAMVVGRPQTTLYAAPGGSKVLVKSLVAGPVAESLSTSFWLGNSPAVSAGTMDMALFDIGIYGNPLTRSEVVAEFQALSGVYGGDS